jgi:hypothetical protein
MACLISLYLGFLQLLLCLVVGSTSSTLLCLFLGVPMYTGFVLCTNYIIEFHFEAGGIPTHTYYWLVSSPTHHVYVSGHFLSTLHRHLLLTLMRSLPVCPYSEEHLHLHQLHLSFPLLTSTPPPDSFMKTSTVCFPISTPFWLIIAHG